MFAVQVCTQIFDQKINFEFTFPTRPSLLQLSMTTESSFTTEIANRRPVGVPDHTFHVLKFKVYDDSRGRWVDLFSDTQLIDHCQVCAFQPENAWHTEHQQEIPAPVTPPTAQSNVPTVPPSTYAPLNPVPSQPNTMPTAQCAKELDTSGSYFENSQPLEITHPPKTEPSKRKKFHCSSCMCVMS